MVGLTPCLPSLLQPELLSPQQATADPCLCRRHSNAQRQAGSNFCVGPWIMVHKRFCLSPLSITGGYGFDSKRVSPLLTSYWGLSFAFECGVFFFFFCGIQQSPVDGCSAVSCEFGVLIGEDECKSFYFTILWNHLFPV